jgi:hypothetical protein
MLYLNSDAKTIKAVAALTPLKLIGRRADSQRRKHSKEESAKDDGRCSRL